MIWSKRFWVISLMNCGAFRCTNVLGVHWKDWCWSWNSNTLATSCEELTRWKRPWCWGGLGAGAEEDDRGWDDWMASPTRWTWVWIDSGSWWWTGRPGVLRFMGSQRVGHDWTTELNCTEWKDAHIAHICAFLGKVNDHFHQESSGTQCLTVHTARVQWQICHLTVFVVLGKLLNFPISSSVKRTIVHC